MSVQEGNAKRIECDMLENRIVQLEAERHYLRQWFVDREASYERGFVLGFLRPLRRTDVSSDSSAGDLP